MSGSMCDGIRRLVLLSMALGCGIWCDLATVAAQGIPANCDYEVAYRDYFGQLRETGYLPLRVEITRYGNQVAKDELLYVCFESSSLYYSSARTKRSYVRPVLFKSGQASATVDLLVSCLDRGENGYVVVSRDGSASRQMRSSLVAALPPFDWLGRQSWNANRTVDGITIGFFSSTPWIDTSWRATGFRVDGNKFIPGPNQSPSLTKSGSLDAIPTFKALVSTLGTSAKRESVAGSTIPMQRQPDLQAALESRDLVVGDLEVIPENWLGLIRLDCMVLSVADFRDLAARYPTRVEAVRRWVVAGGRLVISDCGEDYQGLPTIVPNLNSGMTAPQRPAVMEWSTMDPNRLEAETQHLAATRKVAQQREGEVVQETYSYWEQTSSRAENLVAQSLSQKKQNGDVSVLRGDAREIANQGASQQAPWLRYEYGLGSIVAHPSDFSQATATDWSSLLVATLGDGRQTAYQNHGVDQHDWKHRVPLRVPGVGAPPWMTFLCLMIGFAILVGPVAFVWLHSIGRIQWLLGLVPAMATAVTVGIVTFAVFQDGLGFRTVRLSATRLDSQNQVAYVHTAQAVYSGWAPNAYEFTDQTAALSGTWRQYYGPIPPLRVLQEDQSTMVSGGQIQARTPHSITTIVIKNTPVRVLLSQSGNGEWIVENQLGVPLQFLFVQTEDGLRLARDIDAGQKVELTADLGPYDDWVSEKRTKLDDELQGAAAWWRAQDGLDLTKSREDLMAQVFHQLSRSTNGVYGPKELKVGEFIAISQEQPMAPALHPDPMSEEEMHAWIGTTIRQGGRPVMRSGAATEESKMSPEDASEGSRTVGEGDE
jgi:hypothetical protein